jgi:hypothetical protein
LFLGIFYTFYYFQALEHHWQMAIAIAQTRLLESASQDGSDFRDWLVSISD